MSTGPDPKEKDLNRDEAKETEEIGGIFAGIKKIVNWVKNAVKSIFKPSEESKEKQIVRAVAGFLEKPTNNLEDIIKNTTLIGQVCGDYDQMGMDIPPDIDAMHARLLALICTNRMSFVEQEIKKGSHDTPEIKYAMKMADDRATILSRGYKDDTMLNAVNELQKRLNPV